MTELENDDTRTIVVSKKIHMILDQMRKNGQYKMSFNSLIQQLIQDRETLEQLKDEFDFSDVKL